MPRGKEFCPYENDFFSVKAFKMVDGTRIHNVEPVHRATDGVLVKIVDGKVIETQPVPHPPLMAPPP